jgi:hypothetical protein
MKITGAKISLALLAATLFLGVTQFTSSQDKQPLDSGTQNISNEIQKKPVAIYDRALPDDAQERSLRISKNSRHDKSYGRTFEALPPDTTMRMIASSWGLDLPALPVSQSDAMVIGTITNAQGYVSNDKTGAYSEFQVHIQEVLKNDGRLPKDQIVVERKGASVKLKDGRTIDVGISGQGFPQTGQNYLLFLKYNNDVDDYQLVTAYNLENGKVHPLDTVGQLNSYNMVDVDVFLKEVHQALINPPKSPKKGGIN